MPFTNIQKEDQFWLKNVHYCLRDIFGRSQPSAEAYSDMFTGGTIFQAYLNACYYHRWHSPVDGTIVDDYPIQGHYFADLSEFSSGLEEDSLSSCQPFLASVSSRRIIIIEADNPKLGKVGLVYIGMAEISSCISSISKGQKVKKGEELGRF